MDMFSLLAFIRTPLWFCADKIFCVVDVSGSLVLGLLRIGAKRTGAIYVTLRICMRRNDRVGGFAFFHPVRDCIELIPGKRTFSTLAMESPGGHEQAHLAVGLIEPAIGLYSILIQLDLNERGDGRVFPAVIKNNLASVVKHTLQLGRLYSVNRVFGQLVGTRSVLIEVEGMEVPIRVLKEHAERWDRGAVGILSSNRTRRHCSSERITRIKLLSCARILRASQ